MFDATGAPRRMRYSFEARCRAVQAMCAGLSPGAAAGTVGASRASSYRWWGRFEAGGWRWGVQGRSRRLAQPAAR